MRPAGSRWWEAIVKWRGVGEDTRWCRHNSQPIEITYFEGGYRHARCLRCGIVGPAVWGMPKLRGYSYSQDRTKTKPRRIVGTRIGVTNG
jgi:hypothetical protein